MRTLIISATISTILAATSPALAGVDVNALFSVTADGWNIGELEATYKERGSSYDVTLKGGARGLWGFLLQATYDGHSFGTINNSGAAVSTLFEARSHRIFKSRHQQVDFKRGQPVKVMVDPEDDLTNMSDPTLVTDQRIDPLTYLGIFLQDRKKGCPKAADLYDGRRETHVSFNLVTSKTADIACEGTYEIVKGPDHSIRKGYRSFSVRLEYKTVTSGNARLERLNFTSGGNTLVLGRLK